MTWDGAAAERRIWAGAKSGDTINTGYLRACYLKGPNGDPTLKGSWSYPYRGSPAERPHCGGLLAAEQRAKGTGNDPGVATKARRLRARYCGASSEDSEQDICLNSGDLIETDDELIVQSAGVMHAGVYNGKLKPPEELIESVRWWHGIPITIQSDSSIADHTPTGIVTAKTVVVGQVMDPVWSESDLRINADLHFIKDSTPEWLQNDIRSRKTHGVSGAYFCDFLEENGEENGKAYTAVELNYRPNNLAIVERPACKPPECGIFVNSNTINSDYVTVTGTWSGDGTFSPYVEGDGTIENPYKFIKINSEEQTMSDDTIKDLIKIEVEKTKLELNSEHQKALDAKDRELADKITEIAQLNSQKTELEAKLKEATDSLAEVELNSKKLKFLGQFPEVNREAAEKDLWPVYLDNPSELVMNSAKIAELMKTAEDAPVSQGKEFVKNSDADAYLPTADDIKTQMGL